MDFNITEMQSEKEKNIKTQFQEIYKNCPIPQDEVLSNLGLFINRQSLTRILFMNSLYKKIIETHGVIMEFGVRWGQNLALFESFRGMYEPFNHNRKIIGFDTFSGFEGVEKEKDGEGRHLQEGAHGVTEGYYEYLDDVMTYHENESPLNHIKKYELVKGDATKSIHKYLEENPHTMIALAYFDFDIYNPTKECLMAIKKHMVKGCVIGFDELNCELFPGETKAFNEVFGINNYHVKRDPNGSLPSYIIYE